MMKNNILISVVCGFLALSCAKELEVNGGSNDLSDLVPVTVTAGIDEGATTKVEFGDVVDNKTLLYWDSSDAFDFKVEETIYKFKVSKVNNDLTTAQFMCEKAPSVPPPGTYTAVYPSDFRGVPVMQNGFLSDVDQYLHMTAVCEVQEGDSWEDLSIRFQSEVAIVRVKLSHSDFVGKEVYNIALNNNYEIVASTFRPENTYRTGNEDGSILVYFAVKGGTVFNNTCVTAVCEEKNYKVEISDSKTLESGKMYRVDKEMSVMEGVERDNRYLIYELHNEVVPSGDDVWVMNPFFQSRVSNIQEIELKFQLSEYRKPLYSNALAYLFYSEMPSRNNGVLIKENGIVIRWNNNLDDVIENEKIFTWDELGVSPTERITLKISLSNDVMIVNGREFSIPEVGTFENISYWFSAYSYIDDSDGYEKKYMSMPSGSKIYYAKVWNASGNLIYYGHADICEATNGSMQYAWKSEYNGNTSIEFPNTNFQDLWVSSFANWPHFKGGVDVGAHDSGQDSGENGDSGDELPASYSVQLTTTASAYGWRLSSAVSNPDPSLYDGVYESMNMGYDNTASFIYINISGYENFKFYVRSYAESTYDYVVVSNLDSTLTQSTTDGASVKMTTKGSQSSVTSINGYTLVEFTGIDKGQHTITIMYRKDVSRSLGDDKGYVLIPKNQ